MSVVQFKPKAIARPPSKEQERQPIYDKSELDKRVAEIIKQHATLLRKNKKEPNKSDIRTLKYLYDACVAMLPQAQIDYEKSGRGLWSFSILSSNLREISADLRSLDTGQQRVDHIANNIFVPLIKTLLTHVLNDYAAAKLLISKSVPPKQAKKIINQLNQKLAAHGNLLNDFTTEFERQLREYML